VDFRFFTSWLFNDGRVEQSLHGIITIVQNVKNRLSGKGFEGAIFGISLVCFWVGYPSLGNLNRCYYLLDFESSVWSYSLSTSFAAYKQPVASTANTNITNNFFIYFPFFYKFKKYCNTLSK